MTPPSDTSPRAAHVIQSQATVRQRPDTARAWAGLAQAWIQLSRDSEDPSLYSQASDAIDQGLQVAHDDEILLQMRGQILSQEHRFRELRELAQGLVNRNPHDHLHWGLLGDAALELGDYETARDAYQHMVDLRPDLAAYSRAGWMQWLDGDVTNAERTLQLAVDAIDPHDTPTAAWTHVQLGIFYRNTGRYDDDLHECEIALHYHPHDSPALLEKGRVLLARGDTAGAVTALADANAHNPSTIIAWAYGQALELAGRTSDADERYAYVERVGARSDPRTLAFYLATRGRAPDVALETARQEFDARPDVLSADVLAWAQYRAHHLDDAQASITQALRLGTHDPMFHYHAGMIALARGDTTHASELLGAALHESPLFDAVAARDARQALASISSAAPGGVALPPVRDAAQRP